MGRGAGRAGGGRTSTLRDVGRHAARPSKRLSVSGRGRTSGACSGGALRGEKPAGLHSKSRVGPCATAGSRARKTRGESGLTRRRRRRQRRTADATGQAGQCCCWTTTRRCRKSRCSPAPSLCIQRAAGHSGQQIVGPPTLCLRNSTPGPEPGPTTAGESCSTPFALQAGAAAAMGAPRSPRLSTRPRPGQRTRKRLPGPRRRQAPAVPSGGQATRSAATS